MVAEIAPGRRSAGWRAGTTAMLRIRSSVTRAPRSAPFGPGAARNHLEGDEEEQQAAGDAEGGMVMPKRLG